MRSTRILIVAGALILGACSTSPEPGSDVGSPTNDTSADPGASGDASSVGTATVLLDGEPYEFSTATCVTAGSVLISFEDGANKGSITSAGEVTLIRLDLESGQWVDGGSASPPDQSGDTYTWSGPMSDLDTSETAQVEITVDC